MQLCNRQVSRRGLTVFGFETVLISGSIVLAARLYGSPHDPAGAVWNVVVITAVCELCFYYNDLYNLTLVHTKTELLIRVLQACGLAAMVLAVVSVLAPSVFVGGILVPSLAVLLVAIPAFRIAFEGLARDSHLEERLLIIGSGPVAQTVAQEITAQHDFGYRLVGFIAEPSDEPPHEHEPLVVGTAADLPAVIARHHVKRIVVSLTDRRGKLPIQQLLQAKLSGVRVEDAATTYERISGKILADAIKPSWLIFSDGFRASRVTRAAKRALDVLFAFVGLTVAAPLMLLTAIAVRLESPGPVLYSQERIGENGRVFTLFKFRSMRADAESGTPVWAADRDDRVTRVGRFIRLTRLDELPQLWNVLIGDMSFVGPRPERSFFVEQLASRIPFYVERHAVKPGVTGWAQVKYRYGSSFEDAVEKLRYDLYYIKHMSIVFDLTIVMDTIKVILSGKGAK